MVFTQIWYLHKQGLQDQNKGITNCAEKHESSPLSVPKKHRGDCVREIITVRRSKRGVFLIGGNTVFYNIVFYCKFELASFDIFNFYESTLFI